MKDLRKTAEEIWQKHMSFSSAMCHNESERFESLINAMLEMYQLDRPKPIPFDANDPKTFPTYSGKYWRRVNDKWEIETWFNNSTPKGWDYTPNYKVTHYAEILMPEE